MSNAIYIKIHKIYEGLMIRNNMFPSSLLWNFGPPPTINRQPKTSGPSVSKIFIEIFFYNTMLKCEEHNFFNRSKYLFDIIFFHTCLFIHIFRERRTLIWYFANNNQFQLSTTTILSVCNISFDDKAQMTNIMIIYIAYLWHNFSTLYINVFIKLFMN